MRFEGSYVHGTFIFKIENLRKKYDYSGYKDTF